MSTLFHHPAERRLLFATPRRNATAFMFFANDLNARGGDANAIDAVSMDMFKAYRAGARKCFPNATLCFDPFHVIALGSEALQQVGRAERKTGPELQGSRLALLKNRKVWPSRNSR